MIYDVQTKNLSFLAVSKQLRDQGVKNNKFMLLLYDTSLIGVDPWDPNLTPEQQLAVYVECCRNVWYYIREVQRVAVAGADVPYSAHVGNIASTYLRTKNKNYIIEQSRQTGKTTATIIFDSWLYQFGSKNANIVYMHKD